MPVSGDQNKPSHNYQKFARVVVIGGQLALVMARLTTTNHCGQSTASTETQKQPTDWRIKVSIQLELTSGTSDMARAAAFTTKSLTESL